MYLQKQDFLLAGVGNEDNKFQQFYRTEELGFFEDKKMRSFPYSGSQKRGTLLSLSTCSALRTNNPSLE